MSNYWIGDYNIHNNFLLKTVLTITIILSANQFGINVKKVQKIVSNLSQIMTKKQTKEVKIKESTRIETFDDEELDYDDSSYADMDLDYTTQY